MSIWKFHCEVCATQLNRIRQKMEKKMMQMQALKQRLFPGVESAMSFCAPSLAPKIPIITSEVHSPTPSAGVPSASVSLEIPFPPAEIALTSPLGCIGCVMLVLMAGEYA